MSIGCKYCHDKNCLETCSLSKQTGGSHYKQMKIQPVQYIHGNGIGFCEGSVIKYVTRWKQKNGIEDLRKARHFLDLLIDLEEKKARENTYENVDQLRGKLGAFLENPFPDKIGGGK
jgi:Protein of unknwon function (DUF3310)